MATQVSTTPVPPLFPTGRDTVSPLQWLADILGDVRELYRYRAVLSNLVIQDLRVRYHRSLLGFFWTLLNPILMMAVMSVVFSQLFRFGGGSGATYALHLFSGMVPWTLLAGTVGEGATCIICNEYLIRKVYLPKMILPISRVVLNATMLSFSMAALFLMMVPLGARFTPGLVLLPVVILLFSAFALGLGLIAAVVNTFYRDFGHLLTVLLQAWYFATPIIYPLDALPEEIQWRFWLNPAYPFIHLFQTIIRDGQWPSMVLVSSAAGIAAVVLGIGYATFKAYEDKLVFRV